MIGMSLTLSVAYALARDFRFVVFFARRAGTGAGRQDCRRIVAPHP